MTFESVEENLGLHSFSNHEKILIR
jgi:hypothetical protein